MSASVVISRDVRGGSGLELINARAVYFVARWTLLWEGSQVAGYGLLTGMDEAAGNRFVLLCTRDFL